MKDLLDMHRRITAYKPKKLTISIQNDIRRAYKRGTPLLALAIKYDVPTTTIESICDSITKH